MSDQSQPLTPEAQSSLDHCCASLASCSSGQRDALFTAREALVQFTSHLRSGNGKFLPLCEAMQRMLGQLLRRSSLTEEEALEMGHAVMGFLRSELMQLAPPEAPGQRQDGPHMTTGFTGRTIPPLPKADLPQVTPMRTGPPTQQPQPPTHPNQIPGLVHRTAPQAPGPIPAPPSPAVTQAVPNPAMTQAIPTPEQVRQNAAATTQAMPIQGQQPDPAAPAPPLPAGFVNETRLGEILCGIGAISSEQLDRALVLQKVAKRRLGEVLVVMQAISQEQLQYALQYQQTVARSLSEASSTQVLHPPQQ